MSDWRCRLLGHQWYQGNRTPQPSMAVSQPRMAVEQAQRWLSDLYLWRWEGAYEGFHFTDLEYPPFLYCKRCPIEVDVPRGIRRPAGWVTTPSSTATHPK